MAGGRPTSDPKTRLLAVRLAERHVRWLRSRALHDDVTLSEALRRLLDEHAPPSKPRPLTPKQRREFDQLFAVFGFRPRARKKQRTPPGPPRRT